MQFVVFVVVRFGEEVGVDVRFFSFDLQCVCLGWGFVQGDIVWEIVIFGEFIFCGVII